MLDNFKIRDQDNKSLKKLLLNKLKGFGIEMNSRKHILQCKGNKNINFNLKYLGADDKAGPNYTGQEVVNSYYKSLDVSQ